MKQLQNSGALFAGAAVALLVSQPARAAVTLVTGVRLNPTASGLNVVLETSSGARPQIITSRLGKALVTDIINTQLRLPQGNSFRQDNPAPGIASVVITALDSNSIQLAVTGTTSAPSGQIAQRDGQGITLSLNPAASVTAALIPANPAAAALSPPPPQPARTPTTQTPNVLVPNPDITIDGKPATAAQTDQSASPAPPFLPRAVAPPVGDIAVSNSDASPSTINLDTTERVPRLVLRDAPAREVLALLARAAGFNLVFTVAPAPGGGDQGQPAQSTTNPEGPTVSLDVENESVQDVFNYVLRISGLQANRNGHTILVGPTLSNQARDVVVRSFRLNQVTVGVALNFLVGFGAESAVSRERVITSVNAVPVGGSPTPATQTQTSTETRVETQRINFQDAVPLLRGLQAVGDERTNSITLVGSSKQVDIATTQLLQLDARRRQVAVNVKIIDVNLLATNNFNTSFSFRAGNSFITNNASGLTFNSGGYPGVTRPPGRFVGLLQAAIQNANAKILTDPTLIVQEGQQANVNLTSQVLGNVTSQITATAQTPITTVTATKEQVGLTLSIRIERIDDNGFVSLSVAPIVRAPQQTINLNLGSNGGSQQITLISERSLNSGLLRLRDHQTLILSGIIQDSDTATVNKVPILGDIPLLGALFRSTTKNHGRQEVVVLLTPQIIEDSARSSFGYNYTPGPDVHRILENGGLSVPKK